MKLILIKGLLLGTITLPAYFASAQGAKSRSTSSEIEGAVISNPAKDSLDESQLPAESVQRSVPSKRKKINRKPPNLNIEARIQYDDQGRIIKSKGNMKLFDLNDEQIAEHNKKIDAKNSESPAHSK